MLQPFWKRHLGKKTYPFLQEAIPETWIIDARPLPPHAVIPNLEVDGNVVTDWRQLGAVTQKQRELVIKPSGFSELAWGSRGVAIGHDLPTEDWEAVIENSLANFARSPHVLQKFHTAERVRMQYYDFDREDVQEMACRPLLRPYYFVVGVILLNSVVCKRRFVLPIRRFYTGWWILLLCRVHKCDEIIIKTQVTSCLST